MVYHISSENHHSQQRQKRGLSFRSHLTPPDLAQRARKPLECSGA